MAGKSGSGEVVANIHVENPHNYFVFMLGIEDERDGVMIGFGLTSHPDFGAYLHLDENLLDEIVKKYGAESCPKRKLRCRDRDVRPPAPAPQGAPIQETVRQKDGQGSPQKGRASLFVKALCVASVCV